MDERLPLRIIAATRNPVKLREFQRVVGEPAVIEPLPQDISLPAKVAEKLESYQKFETIAYQKATVWSKYIGGDRTVIASDGGLSIPALGHFWEPTRTRRFAGSTATDLQRARRVLRLTKHLEGRDRVVRWLEVLNAVRNGEYLYNWYGGGNPGLLATEVTPEAIERADGFWVSALWQCPEFDFRLLVDLSKEERIQLRDHWFEFEGPVRRWIAAGCPKVGP